MSTLFPELDPVPEDRTAQAEMAARIAKAADERDGLVRRVGSTDTQRAGARKIKARSGTRRAKVFEVIANAGERGITDYELEMELAERYPNERWSYGDYAPRRRELVGDGLVVDSGDRRRAGDTGSPQIVWRQA